MCGWSIPQIGFEDEIGVQIYSGPLETVPHASSYSEQIMFQKERLSLDDNSNITCFEWVLSINVLNTSKPMSLSPPNNMDGSQIYPNWIGSNNKEFSLDCSVIGVPAPSIAWFKDETPITAVKDLSYEIDENGKELKVSWYETEKAGYESKPRFNQTVTGTYTCVASNVAGNLTMIKKISDGNLIERLWGDSAGRNLLIGTTVTFSILSILLLCVLYLCRRQKLAKEEISAREIACFLHGNPEEYNESLPVEEQVCLLPYDDEIEFPKQRLTLGQQIGSGAFGKVVSL